MHCSYGTTVVYPEIWFRMFGHFACLCNTYGLQLERKLLFLVLFWARRLPPLSCLVAWLVCVPSSRSISFTASPNLRRGRAWRDSQGLFLLQPWQLVWDFVRRFGWWWEVELGLVVTGPRWGSRKSCQCTMSTVHYLGAPLTVRIL